MKSKIDYKKQGKRNRETGQRFELKVKKDMESRGWVVDRWSNNVGMWDGEGNQVTKKKDKYVIQKTKKEINFEDIIFDKNIPAKSRFGMRTTGFPDLITFKIREGYSYYDEEGKTIDECLHFTNDRIVMGVEVKSDGYLDKIEKKKCRWLLNNKIFNKILIASKSKKKRGKINYNEFSNEK